MLGEQAVRKLQAPPPLNSAAMGSADRASQPPARSGKITRISPHSPNRPAAVFGTSPAANAAGGADAWHSLELLLIDASSAWVLSNSLAVFLHHEPRIKFVPQQRPMHEHVHHSRAACPRCGNLRCWLVWCELSLADLCFSCRSSSPKLDNGPIRRGCDCRGWHDRHITTKLSSFEDEVVMQRAERALPDADVPTRKTRYVGSRAEAKSI
jgi:hypothetical protein